MSRPLPSAMLSLLPVWLVVALLPFGRSAELGVAFALAGLAVALSRQPRRLAGHPGARLLGVLLACYIGAAFASAVDAVAPGKSWGSAAGLLRYLPLGLYACLVVDRAAAVRRLYLAVALVLGVWVVDAWMQALTGWSLGGPAEAERISGIFGADNLKLGPTLAVLAPLALEAARRVGRWGWPVAYALLAGPVLLAGSRAAWISFALVGLAFAWREAASPRRFLAWCLAGLAGVALAGALAWQVSSRFHERMERTLAATAGNAQGWNEALTGRLSIWRAGVRMFAAHPVNGVGVRGFRYAYPAYAPPGDHFLVAESCGAGEGACHAHQLVLEILSETGTLGLVLWLAGAAWAWRAWRRAGPAARSQAFAPGVALLAMLFPLNTHLAFYSAWWGLLFAWLLGVWCAAMYARTEARDG